MLSSGDWRGADEDSLKSTDRGHTWVSISGNLPETGSVYAFAEDPVNPKLLFTGTEFGLYFTQIGYYSLEIVEDIDFASPTILDGTQFDVMFRLVDSLTSPANELRTGCFTVTVK